MLTFFEPIFKKKMNLFVFFQALMKSEGFQENESGGILRYISFRKSSDEYIRL